MSELVSKQAAYVEALKATTKNSAAMFASAVEANVNLVKGAYEAAKV